MCSTSAELLLELHHRESIDDSDLRSISTFTDEIGIMTPTTDVYYADATRIGNDVIRKYLELGYIPSVPVPHFTYKIHHRKSKKLLVLKRGDLELRRAEDRVPGGAYLWTCYEDLGWLGFYNDVSGTYIGWSEATTGNMMDARTNDAFYNTHLCVQPHRHGGSKILIKKRNELLGLAVGKDGSLVVVDASNGDQWDFEDVDEEV